MQSSLKSVEASILINEPKAKVWDIWSKFINVSDYIASIPVSYGVGKVETGLGACRRCDISKKMQVEERITAWDEGNNFSMEVYKATGAPIDKLEVDFTVSEQGDSTRADMIIRYRMKGVLRFLPTSGLLRSQARDHLIGLKHHLETGEMITEKIMKVARKNNKSK